MRVHQGWVIPLHEPGRLRRVFRAGVFVLVAILIGTGSGTPTGQGEGAQPGRGGVETTAQGGGQTAGGEGNSSRGRLDLFAARRAGLPRARSHERGDRKSTRLNSSHANISYAVF